MNEEINTLKENQARTKLQVQELRASQSDIVSKYVSNSQEIETLRSEFFSCRGKEDMYVFHAPDTFLWFTGRTNEIKKIEVILTENEQLKQSSAKKRQYVG